VTGELGGVNVIVCDVEVAVPPSKIVCVTLDPFMLLSVTTSDPLIVPAAVGAKLIGSVQDAPTASVPADEAVLPINGQAVPPVLFRVKFAAILGLFPLVGIGSVSAIFPLFHSDTVCGLSLLVELTAVDAKLSPLVLALTLRMRALLVSAI
jgi:hypothetical protein